ncbi:LysR family transcriptional regulator [Siphonobacter sp. SORGH_AS_0500]|uniref:LysR family transcriptional regulator n=1 Tax=Siphonobacter sp. SORGH_AS_0500 TaxID=1864824 RepID=UPI000CB7F507|nr:LysR family transcriptional regulator [Siphonobacter sp. SORGH_AS_0500]MDR6193234.1 DNA-binding transcriptional LysR family regulator [Siphonobacter sp. SORGH_AS_0500]PKK36705.1 LysR family transcriptional regulator [Siphonobacter sp. SORGH_AS_0500]
MQGNLEWFRTFRAIYETGTMSGAAKELFVSQPGVGLHINALEAYTGFPLFERTARRMIPTEKGKLLYKQMIGALNCLEEIEQRFKQKSGNINATVSIGMCVETFQHVLEKYIPTLDFNLMMQFGNNKQLLQLLEHGSVDLILTTETSNCSSLVLKPFTTEKFLLVSGKQTDISGFQSSDREALMDWLKSQIWYSTAADMESLSRFWEANFNERPDFVPNYIVPNKFSITRCLSGGKGLAILPDFLCRDAIETGDIIKLWEGYVDVENTIYFGQRKKSLYANEIECIEQMLRNEFKS